MYLGLNSLWLEFKITSRWDGLHALAPPLSGRPKVCVSIGSGATLLAMVGHAASSLFFLSCLSSRSSMPSTHEAIEGITPLPVAASADRAHCENASLPGAGDNPPVC